MRRYPLRTILYPLLLAAGIVGGILFGNYLGSNRSAYRLRGLLQQMAGSQNKLTHTLALIEREYVDSISMDTLAEHLIPVVLKELDPHSVYIPASEMAELNEPLEGEFDGIGVVFNMATDTVIVLNVIP
ncbi:MAG: S41 family peptidase, partial [Alistipes sp.]|nr:S41 family peptidase [Alistipes sp.]